LKKKTPNQCHELQPEKGKKIIERIPANCLCQVCVKVSKSLKMSV